MNETRATPPCPVGATENSAPFQRWVRVAVCCLLSLHLASPANARILRVAQDGDGTDGQSWDTAFTGIGSAIVHAVSGDRIWVASGSYEERILSRRVFPCMEDLPETKTRGR